MEKIIYQIDKMMRTHIVTYMNWTDTNSFALKSTKWNQIQEKEDVAEDREHEKKLHVFFNKYHVHVNLITRFVNGIIIGRKTRVSIPLGPRQSLIIQYTPSSFCNLLWWKLNTIDPLSYFIIGILIKVDNFLIIIENVKRENNNRDIKY